jgi:hypothetical protein
MHKFDILYALESQNAKPKTMLKQSIMQALPHKR